MASSDLEALIGGTLPTTDDAAVRLAAEIVGRLGAEFRSAGSFIEHPGSGVSFAIVPGGASVMGALASEQAHFDEAAFLDDPRHQDAVDAGELGVLRRTTLASVPALATRLSPFLLARAPMTRAQAEASGLFERSKTGPRIFGEALEEPYYFMPGELEALDVPSGFRLPDEQEWEHACRFGGSNPFRWGTELPSEPIDPPHPLGLRALGWHRERCAGRFRQSYLANAGATSDGVARGGAAALHPWQVGCAEWTLMLPSRRVRLSNDPIDGQYAVRWALDIPGLRQAAAEPAPLSERIVPTSAAASTRAIVEALGSGEPGARDGALQQAAQLGAGGLWSAQGVHVVPALIDALSAADDSEVPRVAGALAILAAGDPAAFSATGFDPARPGWMAACATNASRAVRCALDEQAPRLARLLEQGSARARIHVAYPLPLVAPRSEILAEALAAALRREDDELALLSEAIAYGLVAGRLRWSATPDFALPDGPLPRAARALMRVPMGHPPSEDERAALVELVRLRPADADDVPWRGGRLDMLAAFHLDAHDPSPLAAARFLASLARAAGAEHALVQSYVSGALALGFRGRRVDGAGELSDAERAVLDALSHFDIESPRIHGSFEALGVPAKAEARRRWLAS